MKSLYPLLLVSAYCTLVLGASLQGLNSYAELADGPGLTAPEMHKSMDSYNSYVNWARQLAANRHPSAIKKRYSDLNMPFKYQLDKRNNGVWIWMPAQGYVSVPKQQAALNDVEDKPGKIMRYGK